MCLDAIARAGQTQNVGFLFYSDEETDFYGMRHFVAAHPEVSPTFGLSLCGGHAKAYLGWRGCLEMEFLIKGKSAHASKPDEGANAAEAISYVMETVRQACSSSKTDVKTSANIAAIRAGSAGSAQDFCTENRQAPEMVNIANKVPDMAWALLDVRPGGPQVTTSFIQSVAEQALVDWNKVDGRKHKAELKVRINLDMPSYKADDVRIQSLFERFAPVHHGQISELEKTGFLDTTLISSRHGTQFMCLTPAGDNMHAADEYVEIASLLTYRDCLVALLKEHTSL